MAHDCGSGKGVIEAFTTMFVAKFKFLWHLHLSVAARFFAKFFAILCIQGASNFDALVSLPLFMFNDVRFL